MNGKEKRRVPIVPYLRLPEAPDEKAYLVGSRCRVCGETYLGQRKACLKCHSVDSFDEIALSTRGRLLVYTVVHQSAPGVPVPHIAGIVMLPEGVHLRTNIIGVPAELGILQAGSEVEMVTQVVREDSEGNEIVAYVFRPVEGG